MATRTETLGLKKPDPTDFVNIADINDNMDAIDAAIAEAKSDVDTTVAALLLRGTTRFGTADDVNLLLPGDRLIITDGSTPNPVTYQDLIWEAQKANAGEYNTFDRIAVLSIINGTNWRRDANGTIWATSTVAEFKTKLSAFVTAALASGYVAQDGRCTATWAQGQAWLLVGRVLTPLEAEAMDYPWRLPLDNPRLTEVQERLQSIEAQLGEATEANNNMRNGGN